MIVCITKSHQGLQGELMQLDALEGNVLLFLNVSRDLDLESFGVSGLTDKDEAPSINKYGLIFTNMMENRYQL